MRQRAMLNLPNSLTLLRIFLVPILVVILLTKFEGKELWGLGVFLVAAFTDFLDGYLARKRGEVTNLGKLLDPVADKLLVSAALISLVQERIASAWMVVIIIGREFAVMGLRNIASMQGIVIPASYWGKYKMATQVVAISVLIMADHRWGPSALLETGSQARWVCWYALLLVVVMAILSAVDYFITFSRVFSTRGER